MSFCGSNNLETRRIWPDHQLPWATTCKNCLADGPAEKSKEEAEENWKKRQGDKWNTVDSYDKESCPEVLLSVLNEEGSRCVIIGEFIPRYSVEYIDEYDTGWGERRPDQEDDDDTEYCPEGWYEIVANSDEVCSTIIPKSWKIFGWMPLPKALEVGNE